MWKLCEETFDRKRQCAKEDEATLDGSHSNLSLSKRHQDFFCMKTYLGLEACVILNHKQPSPEEKAAFEKISKKKTPGAKIRP
jgi:hypothetical protein